MAGEAALAGTSVQETEADPDLLLEPSIPVDTSLVEPWRVFPDVDIEIPGDRVDKRGNPTEGPGVFRVHSLDVFCEDYITKEQKEAAEDKKAPRCYNDYGWGATYRLVQNILSVLRHAEITIWKNSAHHHKGDVPPLTVEQVCTLPELTLAMGAGNAWVPPDEEEEEEHDSAEGSQAGPKERFEECAVVEPHDVRDYLSANFPQACGPMRLVTFQTREGASLLRSRMSLLGKESVYEVLERAPGTYEIGSAETASAAMRVRDLIATHLFTAKKPVLVDDSVNSYLVVGYREFDPEGPCEEAPVQYRIIDAQYGLRYAERRYDFIFDHEKGPDQLGTDIAKDQWVPAEWLEEGRNVNNKYIPGPAWMVLLIGDAASSADSIIAANVAEAQAKHDAEEDERKQALHKWLEDQEREGQEAIAAASAAAAAEEEEEVDEDALYAQAEAKRKQEELDAEVRRLQEEQDQAEARRKQEELDAEVRRLQEEQDALYAQAAATRKQEELDAEVRRLQEEQEAPQD